MSQEVLKYIEKQPSPQREICGYLREILVNLYPDLKESMKYGVPYYNDLFYIVGLKDSVNLGFSIKNLSNEEIALFQGTGKTTRHLKFRTKDEINREEIENLIELVKLK